MTIYVPNIGEGQWDSLAGYAPIPVSGGDDPDPPIVDDPGLGTVGDRPVLEERPDATTTGPRQAPNRSLSGADALAEILSSPVESDGKRHLRRVNIGGLTLDKPEHANLVFEDCKITAGAYGLKAFSNGVAPDGDLPEFWYSEISGGSSATVYGGRIRLLRCNLHRGTDIIKTSQPDMEIYACYLHSTWHDTGSHCDVIQIRSGGANNLYHWNNMEGFNASDSPDGSGGEPCNGVLQTGSVTGDIGPIDWENNWFDGGGYTIRGSDGGQYTVSYTFRNNRFGRDFRFGPLYTIGSPSVDSSNVWDDTGLPIL